MRMSENFRLLTVGLVGLLLTGCVMTEKYEAEKARSLNFQRLLAQEEKRSSELDAELKRVTREAAEHEARNRELEAQLKAVREQLAGIQEETDALREAAALMERSRDDVRRSRPSAVRPRRVEKATATDQGAPTLEAPKATATTGETGSPVYHEVQPGETLFRLSRRHGVDVEQIKKWNSLSDDLIEVGQKLIVGYQ